MRRARGWLIYGGLLAVAAALAAASSGDPGGDSPVPSVENAGGSGLRALFLYLRESGAAAHALEAPSTELPADAQVLVIAAPAIRAISAPEIEALEAFVRRGGTLVYLCPRPLGQMQERLHQWLGLSRGARLESNAPGVQDVSDPLGTTLTVWRAFGPLEGSSRLRVKQDRSVRMDSPDAVPVAGTQRAAAIWWRSLGKGQLWILAGSDLAENRRIELADNLQFWSGLAARGPVYFDEFHQRPEDLPPVSKGLLVVALQLVACTLVFAVARGTRLGPARSDPVERNRSTLEYVVSFAWLTRRAKVEKELLPELRQGLRVLLHDRANIPVTLTDLEVARELAQCWHVPEALYLDLMLDFQRTLAQSVVRPADYARLSRGCARLERLFTGSA